MEQEHEFNYLGCLMNDRGAEKVECEDKLMNGRRVPGAIRALVDKKGLSLECASVLHESLLILTDVLK